MADDPASGFSFGPYAAGPPEGRLLGRAVGDLEHSTLFTAAGVRLRRMSGHDRWYAGEHTDYGVTVDANRSVVALMATLLPPDRDVPDTCYRVQVRKDGADEPLLLGYSWAMLLQFAHEVLGFPAAQAAELLNNLYRQDYLPLTVGDVRLALVAGHRMSDRSKSLVLVASLVDPEGPS